MKADARRDGEGGSESSSLREVLRHWPAPESPAELERALVLEFRRRHAPRRRALWLALAAAAALVVAWQLRRGDEAPKAVPAQAAVSVAPVPLPPAVGPAAEGRGSRATEAAAGASRPRPRSAPRTSSPPVIVEPDQGALLVELGRKVWETRLAAAGAVIPQMPEGDVPQYRDEWQAGSIGER